ncbi:alcohol dehydrogenase [Fusarium globosum]|uniref:Alcohol dehydrogenase n=1 Tax=Fusarium globosum TaxID=78864 RepID=A0A8H6DIF5_9HYPO|nr:alcohol dehydrogenase [Fusarium globosum]
MTPYNHRESMVGPSVLGPWLLDKDEALPVLKYAFDKGINTWDVADTYSNGESEGILGAAIKHYNIPRSKLVIMSKCFQFVDEEKGPIDPATLTSNNGPRVNRVGLSRKHILDAGGHDVPPKEIMKALNDVIESGKVRYTGASSEEREMNPDCNYTGVGLFPWSSLAAGVLAHSWTDRTDAREQKDPFLKLLFRGEDQNTNRAVVDRVEELAQKQGVAMANIAQSWLIAKGCMPICGLEREERIDQAVEALQGTLSDEEIKYLEELYVPKMSFPF